MDKMTMNGWTMDRNGQNGMDKNRLVRLVHLSDLSDPSDPSGLVLIFVRLVRKNNKPQFHIFRNNDILILLLDAGVYRSMKEII